MIYQLNIDDVWQRILIANELLVRKQYNSKL